MRQIQLSKDIVPIGEFKAHLAQALLKLKESGRPLVVTQNGRPAAIVLSPEEFDLLLERELFISKVREGLADAEAGRVVSDEELAGALEAEFGPARRKARGARKTSRSVRKTHRSGRGA